MESEEIRPRVIAVMGPTAVGKSQLVLKLARDIGVEVVNADSMQVYRWMDIGTAKPTAEERALVPHHLLDLLDPDQDFDAYRYRQMATAAIMDLARRGRPALVVGGTGLYLKALLHGLFPGASGSQPLRQRLRQEARQKGSTVLHQRLKEVDPITAERLHPRDLVRIIRALEVWESTGRPLSALQKEHGFQERPFQALKIGLHRPRWCLYARIDRRVEEMMAQGFLAEVISLLERGYRPELKSMQALGYRHLLRHLLEGTPLSAVVRTMKRDTRRYAKRQMTWFRHDPEIHWFHPRQGQEILALCRGFLQRTEAVSRSGHGRQPVESDS